MPSPRFIVVVEKKPRSGKQTFFTAKRVDEPAVYRNEIADPTAGTVYEVWSHYERFSDAEERVKELNGTEENTQSA